MNYYKRHIGDYLKDTAHLSLLEHGIYTRLMDVYYTKESAIPNDQAARLIGARTKDELAALKSILNEFFTLQNDAWVQARCEIEITHKDEKAETNRVNGLRGGRPKKETQSVISGLLNQTHSITQSEPTDNPSHKPIANSHKLNESKDSFVGNKPPPPPCPYGQIVELYHEVLGDTLPKVKVIESKQKPIKRLWTWVLTSKTVDGSRRATTAVEALEYMRGYFEQAKQNDWLMGRTSRSGAHANWQCDLEFLTTDKGISHVVEKTLGVDNE
jgi:uncharacterized protein YdaU (DUF1376 family)